MRRGIASIAALLLTFGFVVAEETAFHAYIDSEICAHLMLGPITEQRIECSKNTRKQGDEPAIVRVSDNTVLEVQNPKKVKDLVGEFAAVRGDVKEKAGKINVASAEAVELAQIPASQVSADLIDVRNYRTSGDPVYEKVRHSLATMPYISEFDFISFAMAGNRVLLNGWTVRLTNRKTAYNLARGVEGVEEVINNIQVLPMGRMDMEVRAGARARLQRNLSRYFWGSGSDIKIIVKNGNIILLGRVANQSDSDLARLACQGVPGAFHVFNLLQVKEPNEKTS